MSISDLIRNSTLPISRFRAGTVSKLLQVPWQLTPCSRSTHGTVRSVKHPPRNLLNQQQNLILYDSTRPTYDCRPSWNLLRNRKVVRLGPHSETIGWYSRANLERTTIRRYSAYNGGVSPSLVRRKPREKLLWGTFGLMSVLGVYGAYSYDPHRQEKLNAITVTGPSSEQLLWEIDSKHFSSTDWNDPVQTTLYFRSLVRANMVGNELANPPTKKFTEHFLHLINLFLSLPNETLQKFVSNGHVLEGNELHSFNETAEASRRRMYKVMKNAAHQVHSKVGLAPPYDSEIMLEVERVLSEAYEALAEIAAQDSNRIYRVMKALYVVEMMFFVVG